MYIYCLTVCNANANVTMDHHQRHEFDGKSQQVAYNVKLSAILPLHLGIPILGPTLFNCYTPDIQHVVTVTTVK